MSTAACSSLIQIGVAPVGNPIAVVIHPNAHNVVSTRDAEVKKPYPANDDRHVWRIAWARRPNQRQEIPNAASSTPENTITASRWMVSSLVAPVYRRHNVPPRIDHIPSEPIADFCSRSLLLGHALIASSRPREQKLTADRVMLGGAIALVSDHFMP